MYRKNRWQKLHLDMPLILLLMLLCGIGLMVLYSASEQSQHYLKRQMVFYAVGFVVMLVTAQLSPRLLARWALLPYAIGLLLLVAVLFFGVGAKGAQRWLELGGFRFQPSEIMKVAVPLMLASYLGQRHLPPTLRYVLAALLMMVLPALLVGLQPDLGTALLIFASGFFVLFLAGLHKRYMLGAGLLAMAAIPLFWLFLLHDYQKQRILTLLDPQADRLGSGWNIIQSTTAIGSGGWQGKGWMQGTQSQLDFLPEPHTDFIIAVFSEEFGLAGVLSLLGLYLLIVGRCLFLALRASNMFGRLLAGSIALTFFVYVVVNMGMVSGVLPVVGVPLPLVSYGGTSIVTLMLGFGMLMAVCVDKR
ncbi:rod shape-determining protein RodA [Porticoccus sp. W117]|uniref:rod shape-determining protein RodA n=1 Tax=Porticoccus sp. W117 TaxID=3054777 RepID=UPI002595A521|nr:rod shape-determining protein RodA [Porticoccus sp. W117]MDM3871502.1 rod shape-determining protein RodA [Porticoccus sp. W117]